jgi:hypothetical protein
MSHPIATLKLSRRVPDVIAFAKSIATAMTNNPSFPSPNPALATFEADIAALDNAEAAVLTRTKGAAEARDVKLTIVRQDMEMEKAYVQAIANATPVTAAAVIESAGMKVKVVTLHAKAPLVAEKGSVSGTAHLVAKAAGHRAAYEWQYSSDQKTWTNAPTTLQAKTDIPALPVNTVVYFRVRAVVKAGEGDWSQVVSLTVS